MTSERVAPVVAQCTITALTVSGFYLLYRVLDASQFGYCYVKKRDDPKKLYRWRDDISTLLFAMVMTVWSFYCLYCEPVFFNDFLVAKHASVSYMMAFALGYYIYHFFMWKSHFGYSHPELLLHHVNLWVGLFYSVLFERYHGNIAMMFLNEVITIFFYVRALLITANLANSVWFQLNRWIMTVVYVIIRIPVNFLMLYRVVQEWSDLNLFEKCYLMFVALYSIVYHLYLFFTCCLRTKQKEY